MLSQEACNERYGERYPGRRQPIKRYTAVAQQNVIGRASMRVLSYARCVVVMHYD